MHYEIVDELNWHMVIMRMLVLLLDQTIEKDTITT
jgi:hypothetical protein